jgi:hypothetical protein
MNQNKLLIDSQPIQVLPELAEQIGLNEAIFIQQLHYWLNNECSHLIDGVNWIYNSYRTWKRDNFPFWSEKTIQRIVKSLSNKNLIFTTNKFNDYRPDNKLWYTINYKELKLYELKSIELKEKRNLDKKREKEIRRAKREVRKVNEIKKSLLKASKIEHGQNDQTLRTICPDVEDKMTRPITENTKENTKETNNNNKAMEEIYKRIKELGSIKKDTLYKLIEKYGIDKVDYYLTNLNRFNYSKNPIGFLIKAMENNYKIPENLIMNKPIQSYNFNQREYDEEFFDNIYENL